ncbi:MAG: hypothetical protein FH762_09715 [Firmicutes bacterium]|nr:hypothetical protein [Bacillota bacterium]
MKNYEIIDNIDVLMGDKLNQMIQKSTKSLYAGIGYFLDSGFKSIQDNIIDISNQDSEIKIIAGNLYIKNNSGQSIINPNLDMDTCELIVNLYEQGNKTIKIRSVKDRFFHGKFFLGIGQDKSYLIGGSSNTSFRGISSNGNIEYNLYAEDKNQSDIITINKKWFIKIWEEKAVPLNQDDIENLKFLINKHKFNIDVKEDVFEGGQKENRSKREIQCEIINQILKNIGFNTTEPLMKDENEPNDIFISSIIYLYDNKDSEVIDANSVYGCLKKLQIRFRQDERYVANLLTEEINKITIRDYYYELLDRILNKPVTDRSNKPDYSTLLINVRDVFIEYYEEYHNKSYNPGSYGVNSNSKSLNTEKTTKLYDYKKPYTVTDNRFEYLLKVIAKLKGNYEDDWLFQYQSSDARSVIKMYNLKQNGVYLAHEAGMGKSPIMCKFIKEAQKEKWDVRTLVATPASLLYQWKEDNLLRDFGLPSEIVDNKKLKEEGTKIWQNRKINIVSIDFLKNVIANKEGTEIKSISPDILIIDESHNLKNDDAIRYENISKLNPNFVVLASATPLQNNIKEFLVQLSLIDNTVDIERHRDIEYVRKLRDKYLIRKTRQGELIEIETIDQALRDVKKIKIPCNSDFIYIYDELEQRLKSGELYYYTFLGEIKDMTKKYNNIDAMTSFMILQQITSSGAACVQGLKNIKRKIELILNSDFENLTEELIADYGTGEEREVLRNIFENQDKITPDKINKLKKDLDFINEFIDDNTGKLLEDGEPLKNPKEKMLIETITERCTQNQCIIFVKYLATGESITDILNNNGIKAKFYSGGLNKKQRNDIINEFKNEEVQILVATDSANAGLNLQNTNFLINFDLNWNPQIVEQRIGRVHRIGQKADEVLILNLLLEDTIDNRIFEKMESKVDEFTSLFQISDEIIGEITKNYMSAKSLSEFDVPDLNTESKEDLKIVLEEDTKETGRLNDEYYFTHEALKEMLMWIIDKYNIEYYSEDEETYYLRLDNNQTYKIQLNQIYNMIEKEQEFFVDFYVNNYIKNKKHKDSVNNLDGLYLTMEKINLDNAVDKIKSIPMKDSIEDQIVTLLNKNKGKTILQLNMNIEYSLQKNDEVFAQKEIKPIIITADNSIISDERLIRLFSILPVKDNDRVRVDNIKNYKKYMFIYNNLLADYLSEEKNNNIKDYNIDMKDVKLSIFNGTLYQLI